MVQQESATKKFGIKEFDKGQTGGVRRLQKLMLICNKDNT